MTLLRFDDIRKHFGGVHALDGVTGRVEEGEILGLVGPNGSGKSTLINVLSGLFDPDGGKVVLDGEDITSKPGHRVIEQGVARTYQIPRPFKGMTVGDNVAMALVFGRNAHSPDEAREAAVQWLEFAGLARYRHDPIDRLNLHQLKYLELARALASEPRVLFLDEVLAGLNPSEIEESIRMIRSIHDRGVSLVIVEHVVRVVTALSTRVMVLNQGRVIADGDPEGVMADPEVVRAYLGTRYRRA